MGLLSTIGAASGRAFGLTRVGAAIRDAYFNLTTLLLPGDGTNGAQNNTFLDSSTNNFTITRNGNTTQGTFSPFSQTGWSNSFASGAVLNLNGGTPLTFGTGDFTIEFWVYYNGGLTADVALYDSRPTSTNGVYPLLYSNPTGKMVYYVSSAARITSTTTLVVGTWYHVALARSGTSTKLFINGTQEGSTYTDSNDYLLGTNRPSIGAAGISLGADPLNGYMSNVRVVKGTAVYTSNFTPPTSPLTAITNTSLLTCQSNRFIDNSTNAFAITVTSSPSVQAFSPFAPTAAYSAATVGGSGYFDGTGDYLTGPTNTATAFNLTGNFTIECWAYFNSVATSFAGLVSWADSSGWNGWQFLNNAGTIAFEFLTGSAGAGSVTSSTTVTTGQWFHLAAVRSSSTITLYINGVSRGTSTYSSSQTSSSSFIKVAADRLGTALTTGYIADLRIVNGTAVYTAGFTPPTAPLTAITNTSLLCNFTNAGITDATAKNDLETVGNAQISTTQSKFGGSSMYFDGTGDYLVVGNMSTNPNLALLAGDFTIEYWYYPLNTSIHATLNNLDDGAGNGSLWILMNGTFSGGSKVQFGYNTGGAIGNILFGTGTFTANAWYHVAICRSGSNLRCFINGTQEGSTSTALGTGSIVAYNRNLVIGATLTGGSYTAYNLNGYLDDFRITRFARYTSNFTAPTAAFPLQ